MIGSRFDTPDARDAVCSRRAAAYLVQEVPNSSATLQSALGRSPRPRAFRRTWENAMNLTRRQMLGTTTAAMALGLAPPRAFSETTGLDGQLDAALGGAVERGDVAGVVGAITNASDTIYSAAFGERKLGSGVAMTEDTVCNMASMTKAITGACAMQLVEQGKLDLDSPVATWLPDAGELQVLDGWDGDKPVLRAPARPVTLRHLMTHTSGMAYTQWDADLLKVAEATQEGGAFPPLDYAKPETWTVQPLMFDPGEKWDYGISIDWIGRLVQEVSGKSLGTYMADNIFAPLGMASTSYGMTDDMLARQATIHQREADGKIGFLDPQPGINTGREYGGGGLNGTAGDYQRFIRMILNDGKGNGNQILKPETVAEMSKNQMGDVRVRMLPTTNPARSLDAEFFPGVPKSWGMTFMINEEQAPTGRPAGSLAWAGLYNTFFWIDPKNKVGGVFMSQLLPFVDTRTIEAFYAFESAYHAGST
jgi:methyl acetate hydrolase